MQILFEPILNNWWHKAATFWQTKHTVQWLLTLHLPGFVKQKTVQWLLSFHLSGFGKQKTVLVLAHKTLSQVVADLSSTHCTYPLSAQKWDLLLQSTAPNYTAHTDSTHLIHRPKLHSSHWFYSPDTPPLTTQLTLILLTWYTAPNYTAHTDSTHLIHCPKLHSSQLHFFPFNFQQTQ